MVSDGLRSREKRGSQAMTRTSAVPLRAVLGEYGSLLKEVRRQIRQALARAALSANSEVIALYWRVGRLIHVRRQQEGWGSSVIPRLSRGVRNDLPEVKGFSVRNLKRVIRLYRDYPELIDVLPQSGEQDQSAVGHEIVPQAVHKWRLSNLPEKCHGLWHNRIDAR